MNRASRTSVRLAFLHGSGERNGAIEGRQSDAVFLECVSKILEYAISGVAAPFLRHKARLSAAKPSGFFLELTQNPLELADCSA